MSDKASATRDRILETAYRLFYQQGFSRVSVDAIASAAGVTKRTVYYHFTSKDEIAGEVLKAQHRHLIEEFNGWLDDDLETASDLVLRLFERLEGWARAPGWLGSGYSRVTAELADLKGHPARVAARDHKREVEGWLAKELAVRGKEQPKQAAAALMVLIEGSMSLALIHDDPAYFSTAKVAALKVLGIGNE